VQNLPGFDHPDLALGDGGMIQKNDTVQADQAALTDPRLA